MREHIYLVLTAGENFGWGVCSKYLKKELRKWMKLTPVDKVAQIANQTFDGKSLHALTGIDFESIQPNFRSQENFGYTFFENELTNTSANNAKKYKTIFAGSTWCKDKMEENEILNSKVLLQGIDPKRFSFREKTKNDDSFVIFSGGKFEIRKGQDLVLKAFKILCEKYKDMFLINCWYNFWPQTMLNMKESKHIESNFIDGSWQNVMNNLYSINNIDNSKIITLDVVQNENLSEIYSKTDIGLFPNRCEGGTNLVLMEYMATGRPVVVSNSSGHKDVVSDKNSLLLNDLTPFSLKNEKVDWEEPNLDEIISQIEFAYHNRDNINELGKQAADDMSNLTWAKTAETLFKSL